MDKKFIFFIFIVLLIGLVNATPTTPLQEFMTSSDMTITITQDTTTNVFTMNTSKCSWDVQNVSLGKDQKPFPLSISGILNGINLRVDLENGLNYPKFSNVRIDTSISLLFDLLFSYNGYSFTSEEVNANPSILTNLIRDNLPEETPSAEGNFYFVKEGATYTMGYDKGFGVVSGEYKNQISKIIARGINSMNIKKMLEENLLPLLNIEDYLPIFEELNYEVTEEDIDFSKALLLQNTEYNVSVNLTALKFQDGTYKIPITITPLFGEDRTLLQKDITLVLSGIINQVEEQATVDGIYTPSDAGIKEVIKTIAGLPAGTTINKVQIFDTKPVAVETLSHTAGLKYLVIEVSSQPLSGAQIKFAIEKSKVDYVNRVSLYVWETTTSTWTKLATTYLGETATEYEYSATTPHFSTFMIGETTPVNTDSSSSNDDDDDNNNDSQYSGEIDSEITEMPNAEPSPIELETPKQEEGFFARLGRFLTGQSIDGTETGTNLSPVILMFLLMIIALTVIILAVKRKEKNIRLKTAKILAEK